MCSSFDPLSSFTIASRACRVVKFVLVVAIMFVFYRKPRKTMLRANPYRFDKVDGFNTTLTIVAGGVNLGRVL